MVAMRRVARDARVDWGTRVWVLGMRCSCRVLWAGTCVVEPRCFPLLPQAAIQANPQNSFDDFIAVAEDLITRGVTRPSKLGILGEGNGGLLVAVAMTQRPRLFAAVISKVCVVWDVL